MAIELREYQEEAVQHLGNGKVLWGGVGSGKSAVALAYYMKEEKPRDIYVITTAKKRNSGDWAGEAARFGIGPTRDSTIAGTLTVDSWNNLGKYRDTHNAFFIFDEQRLVGSGVWVRNFLRIARRNHWILLTATPGDTWLDYAPLFVANGYYRNLTHFRAEHIEWEPFVPFPKVKAYHKEHKLNVLRNEVLVEMPYNTDDRRMVNWLDVGHDATQFRRVYRERWHIFEDRPITDVAELFRIMRRVVNSDPSRTEMVEFLLGFHPKLIVFYNFNYELDLLRALGNRLAPEVVTAELNGHRHDDIPQTEKWLYLVQYIAGAEAWNCTQTNAMCLYSLTYSYKNFMQAMGRIDRMDTPFDLLHYYVFVTNSVIDIAIRNSLQDKKDFNQVEFMREKHIWTPSEQDRLELFEADL